MGNPSSVLIETTRTVLSRVSSWSVALCVLAGLWGTPAVANADQQSCLAILAKQNLVSGGGNSASTISYLSSIDKTQFDSYQHANAVGGSVGYGPFSLSAGASFNDFQAALNTYKASIGYTYSAAESQSIATATTPPEAFNAYIKCLQSGSQGVYVVPSASVANAVTLSISYVNNGAAPTTVGLTLHGGTFPNGDVFKKFIVANGGNQTVIVSRAAAANGLLVSVNTSSGGVTYGNGMSYPWQPTVKQPPPLANTDLVMNALPKGTIIAWYGTVADIPANWHVCDGTNGTANLVDRFPYGTSSNVNVGATGGTALYNFAYSGTTNAVDPIGHGYPVQKGTDYAVQEKGHVHTFSGNISANIIPPYTYVIFIQKI